MAVEPDFDKQVARDRERETLRHDLTNRFNMSEEDAWQLVEALEYDEIPQIRKTY